MTGHKSVFSRLIDGEEMDAEKFIHLLESKIDIVHQKLASRSAEQLEIDAFDLQLAYDVLRSFKWSDKPTKELKKTFTEFQVQIKDLYYMVIERSNTLNIDDEVYDFSEYVVTARSKSVLDTLHKIGISSAELIAISDRESEDQQRQLHQIRQEAIEDQETLALSDYPISIRYASKSEETRTLLKRIGISCGYYF